MMNHVRAVLRRYPITASVAVTLAFFGLSALCRGAVSLIPNETAASLTSQVLGLLFPWLLVLCCGRRWIYRRPDFEKTLLAGMFPLVLETMALSGVAMMQLTSPETEWAPPLAALLGLLTLFGVGFREESVFRGIVAGLLWEKYGGTRRGVWCASLLSGLLFGAMHMGNLFYGVNLKSAVIQSVVAAAVGLALAAIYYRGGSIWALILIHSLTDAASLFGTLFVRGGSVADTINELGPVNLAPAVTFTLLTVFLLRPAKCTEITARWHAVFDLPPAGSPFPTKGNGTDIS